MKKIIITAMLMACATSVFASSDFIEVQKVAYENGKTTVLVARTVSSFNIYTQSTSTYSIGEIRKSFNGTLEGQNLADKVALYVDEHITVKNGSFFSQGKNSILALLRSKAFYAGGYDGYFAELAKQLVDEK